MHTAANPAFQPSPSDVKSMNRALTWSVGIHVGVVLLCIVVPREWFVKPPRPKMTITLGGTPGPRSTGTASIGGRAVEQVAPQPRRPDPIRPTTNEPAPAPPKPAAETVKLTRPTKPETPPSRPAATGQRITAGNSPADTGAKGQSTGLTFGGGGTGGDMNVMEFCCPDYLLQLTAQIDARWNKAQPERGVTEIKFTVQKDGQISDVEVTKPSGNGVLDRASRSALIGLKLPPLPAAYPADKLTVNVRFPYEGF